MASKAKIAHLAIALALLAAPAAPAAADAVDDARAKAAQMRADAQAKADAMRAAATADADAMRAAATADADARRAAAQAKADQIRCKLTGDCGGSTGGGGTGGGGTTFTYAWTTGSYGTCSKTCGGGTQTRPASCRRSDGANVSQSFCSSSKPQTTRSCNTQICTAGDTQLPSTPTGLTAKAASCSQIDVSWNAAADKGGSGLKGYDVYRDGKMYTQVTAPLRSLSDGNLPESTTHSYQVAAFDGAGNHSPTNGSKSATTPACASAGELIIGSLKVVSEPLLDVDVSGSLAVTVSLTVLTVVDVTSNAPTNLGSLAFGGVLMGVRVWGDYAYVLEATQGAQAIVHVVDLAKPVAPTWLGKITLAGESQSIPGAGLALADGLLHVATAKGLEILDLSDPASPRPVGMAGIPEAHAVAVERRTAYVSTLGDELLVLDVSNPTRPVFIGTLGSGADHLLAVADRVILSRLNRTGEIFDFSNPSWPRSVRTLSVTANGAAVVGNRVYFTQYPTRGQAVVAFDLSGSGPAPLWREPTATWMRALTSDRDRLFGVDQDGRLLVLDAGR
jgi:hypothetical protein